MMPRTSSMQLARLVLTGLVAGAATVAVCAAGDQTMGGDSTMGSGGSLASAVSANGGSGSLSGGTSSGEPARKNNTLPANAVSFFKGMTCPQGWVPFDAAAGRLLLPSDADRVGKTSGTPLESGEDRTHTHAFTGKIDFPSISYVGIAGGGNHGVGVAGEATLSGTSNPASTRLPYTQLLVCKKVSQPEPNAATIATGMMMFYSAPNCPAGWSQSKTTRGRLIVGLPNDKDAPPDISFGGDPLIGSAGDAGAGGGGDPNDAGAADDAGDASNSSGPGRMHAHANSGGLATEPHGIALAGGCCGGGYAKDGIYPFTGETEPGETGLPYIELLHCQKL